MAYVRKVRPASGAATCSRLLYDTLGAVYDWLGFDIVDDPVFRDLVIAGLWNRAARPTLPGARRDQKALHAQEARARAVINSDRAAKSTRFVKTRAGDRVLDEASLARAQSLVGPKGYVTNIPATVMSAAEVLADVHLASFGDPADLPWR